MSDHYVHDYPDNLDLSYKLLDWIPLNRVLDKVDWRELSKNPNAIRILEQNPDRIDWECLSENPKAIQLLEHNQDKINGEI